MKLEDRFLAGANLLARAMGVLFIVVGVVFLVSAYAIADDRVLNVAVGVSLVVVGVPFLFVKAIPTGLITRMRKSIGWND